MKKEYIEDVIGLSFIYWGRKKIILNAPTGAGKTTFILGKVVPCVRESRKRSRKVLILCNRRLLRNQYLYDARIQFGSYAEMEESVDIRTYQELAAKLQRGEPLNFAEYAVVCLDEVHYFYQDSDFNSTGTYPLFLAIMSAGLGMQMIFISATIECISPFFERIIKKCRENQIERELAASRYLSKACDSECVEFIEPVKDMKPDFSYLNCICVPDRKTLCQKLADSSGKSIVFIDDKKWADDFFNELMETGKIASGDICRLNADNMENGENADVIESLAIANRVIPKILLTTSVLDNGVSVKDPDVKNVVIFTESEVSFKQMIGRVRCESVEEKLNLYFVPRPAEYFEKREIKYGMILKIYENIENRRMENCTYQILNSLLNQEDEIEQTAYKKIISVLPPYLDYDMSYDMHTLSCKEGEIIFSVNPFAVSKIKDLYFVEGKFHKLARQNPLNVIYEQLSWLNIDKKDLRICDSTYIKERERLLGNKLFEMQNYTKERYVDFKEKINSEYGDDLFRDIVNRKGSFSKEKFQQVLDRFGFRLIESKGEDGNMRYSAEKKQDEENA